MFVILSPKLLAMTFSSSSIFLTLFSGALSPVKPTNTGDINPIIVVSSIFDLLLILKKLEYTELLKLIEIISFKVII